MVKWDESFIAFKLNLVFDIVPFLGYNIQVHFFMKVKSSIKRRCRNCKVVIRRGIRRIICSTKRHTQKQG